MSVTVKISSDTKGLDKLLAELRASGGSYAKIGLVGKGAGTSRKAYGGLSFASLGFVHEHGNPDKKIPRRSFLFDPLNINFRDLLSKIKPDYYPKLIAKVRLKKALTEFAQSALSIVDKGFSTKGFGRWPSNAPSTIDKKGFNNPLIHHGAFAKAQNFQVVMKGKV